VQPRPWDLLHELGRQQFEHPQRTGPAGEADRRALVVQVDPGDQPLRREPRLRLGVGRDHDMAVIGLEHGQPGSRQLRPSRESSVSAASGPSLPAR
jgi:hypothetical protein